MEYIAIRNENMDVNLWIWILSIIKCDCYRSHL